MKYFGGIVTDEQTGEPLPGATVSLMSNGKIVLQAAANSKAEWNLQTSAPVSNVVISHAGYNTTVFEPDDSNMIWNISRRYATGEDVIVYAKPKKKSGPLVWLLLLGTALIVASRK